MWAVMSPRSSYFRRKMLPVFETRVIKYVGISRDRRHGLLLDEALADPTITKIYICTPTPVSANLVVKCLKARKSVLVEKGWWGIDPHLPASLAKEMGVSLEIAAQQRFAQERLPPDVAFDEANLTFLMPQLRFAEAFEDVGFYLVLEMLLRGGPHLRRLKLYDMDGTKPVWKGLFQSFGACKSRWTVEFGLESEFEQKVELFVSNKAMWTRAEPFVSRTDTLRYHKVILEFEKLRGVGPCAMLWPQIHKTLKDWKRDVGQDWILDGPRR